MVQVVRSAGLLVVAVLAFLLAACSVGHVYAQWGVAVSKIAIGGEDTDFGFKVVGPGGQVEDFVLKDGEWWGAPGIAGDWVFTETAIPPGWVLRSIDCRSLDGDGESSWEVDLANARVTVHLALYEDVYCTFINQRIAVGGVVTPVSRLGILAPWLAVIGLVVCMTIVVVVVKKRRL